MRLKKLLYSIIIVTILVFSLQITANAAAKKAVFVIINNLMLEDWLELPMPNLQELVADGSLALMNTNTLGSRTFANSLATIAYGKPSSGNDGELSFNNWEAFDGSTVKRLYEARTGRKAVGEIVVLSIPQFLSDNQASQDTILGEALAEAGITRAVLGNADLPGEYHREACLIAMDKYGQIDYGLIDKSLLKPGDLLLQETDYDKTIQNFRELYNKSDFLVVHMGDIERLWSIRNQVFPEIWQNELQNKAAKIDETIGSMVDYLGEEDLLVIASPTPSPDDQKEKNLISPVLLKSKDFTKGQLYSPSTRRLGVISSGDLAPSILSYFSVPIPLAMPGRVLSSRQSDEAGEKLLSLNKRLVFTYKIRPPLIKSYILLQIAAVCIALISLLKKRKLYFFLQWILLGLVTVPLSLLFVGISAYHNIFFYCIKIFVFTVILMTAAIVLARGKIFNAYFIISLATSLTLMFDLLSGAKMISQSILGYDPIAGARYYGIGNEYMGILIGASIIGISGLLEKLRYFRRYQTLFLTIFFGTVTAFIGLPQLGSNVGGTFAGLAGFAITIILLADKGKRKKNFWQTFVFAALFIVILVWLDANRDAQLQSHLGRLVQRVVKENPAVLLEVAFRKLQMNLKLIRYTVWSRVFLVLLLAITILFYRPIRLVKILEEEYPKLFAGLFGVIAGSITALLTNDSGIVLAATMMIFPAFLILQISNLPGILYRKKNIDNS